MQTLACYGMSEFQVSGMKVQTLSRTAIKRVADDWRIQSIR